MTHLSDIEWQLNWTTQKLREGRYHSPERFDAMAKLNARVASQIAHNRHLDALARNDTRDQSKTHRELVKARANELRVM